MTSEEYYAAFLGELKNIDDQYSSERGYTDFKAKMPGMITNARSLLFAIDMSEFEFGEFSIVPYFSQHFSYSSPSIDIWLCENYYITITDERVVLWIEDDTGSNDYEYIPGDIVIHKKDFDDSNLAAFPVEEFLRSYYFGAMASLV